MFDEIIERVQARIKPVTIDELEGKTIAKAYKTADIIGILFADGTCIALEASGDEEGYVLRKVNLMPIEKTGYQNAGYQNEEHMQICMKLGLLTEEDYRDYCVAHAAWREQQRQESERAEYLRLKAKYEAQQ